MSGILRFWAHFKENFNLSNQSDFQQNSTLFLKWPEISVLKNKKCHPNLIKAEEENYDLDEAVMQREQDACVAEEEHSTEGDRDGE